ncbi:hypothetical protein ACFL0Z_00360 [Patescibacteria group bacterium]
MKKAMWLLALLVVLGLMVTPLWAAHASTYQSGDTVITTEEIPDDLYVGGGTVDVTKPVRGDLVAGAGILTISEGAIIEQDILAGGGQILINANVGDDVRVTGGNVTVTSEIGDDLVIIGGNNAVSGIVKGDLNVIGGTLTLDGKVEGNVYFSGGTLVFGENAEVMGNLDYLADEEATMAAGAKVNGETKYTSHQQGGTVMNSSTGMFSGLAGFMGFAIPLLFVFSLVALFLFTLFVVFAAPLKVQDTVVTLRRHPWRSLGWGVVFAIVTPIVAIILLFLLITFPISVMFFLIYGLGWLLAGPLLAFCMGSWLFKLFKKQADFNRKGHLVLASLLGAIIYSLVMLIPFVGGLIILIGLIFTLGALFQVVRPLVFKKREWQKKVEVPTDTV